MTLPDATLRFLRATANLDITIEPREFPEGTKTARDAADAIGCEIGQIVKSLVFVADGQPVVALLPGDLRLDPLKLAATTGGESVRRAALDEVRAATGYVAGGTPPFGHGGSLRTYADLRLRRYDTIWAAAGTPTTVFPITPADLDRAARPSWADLAETG
jgi:Cys-tRNA(Pro) deacylase